MSAAVNESTHNILLVEDDSTIALGVVRMLEMDGFVVKHFTTGEEGLASIADGAPDLAVLDWMLPGMDGIEVLRALKREHPEVPVIMLTARISEQDRVRGLDAGADDYVVKPFSLRELAARIRARLRSKQRVAERDGWVEFGEVKVDLRHRILHRGDDEIRLTTHEAGVLGYLLARPGQDVPRDELLEKVWGYVPTIATRTVDNQILKLRKKIEANPNDPRHILTVYGTGYRFEP
jgi:DNA-binding response OmpR family regulator